jgi:hypothetical protein
MGSRRLVAGGHVDSCCKQGRETGENGRQAGRGAEGVPRSWRPAEGRTAGARRLCSETATSGGW